LRWLFVKDLQILRRSPLVTGLLIVYPIAIAILIGFAISRGPERPTVAFLNEVPADQEFNLGGNEGELDKSAAKQELCSRVECVDVSSRDEAERLVRGGDVLGALILPPDLIDKLQSLSTLNPAQPKVEVLVNEEDPLKAQLVDDRIEALVTEANLAISQKVADQAATYTDLLTRGGTFDIPLLGPAVRILGLKRTGRILEALRNRFPPGSVAADALGRVIRFARLARQNLNLALPFLGSVAHPIEVEKEVVSGSPPSLDVFAISVAATVTLMFVTVLLVAGSLALEREENAFARLTRGLVGQWGLLGEKIGLGVAVSIVVTLLMLAGLSLFVHIEWARLLLIVLAIVAGGAAFAAFGAAIGAAAREVRASSLLAFMVSLPIAFVSLVESGTVSPGLFDAIRIVRAVFPFHAALDAMSGALDASGPAVGPAVLHLAILAGAYGALARVGLRRFVV